MQNQTPEKKPKLNRMTVELAVMAMIFFGLILGVQALQGGASRPKYDPLAMLFSTMRAYIALHEKASPK